MTLQLRSISENEVDSLRKVYTCCHDTMAVGKNTDLSFESLRRRTHSSGLSPTLTGIYDGEGLIGVVDIDPAGEPGLANVALLMLASPRRYDGVGAEAVQLLEVEIRKNPEARAIGSAVEIHNPAALAFWIKMGYHIVDGPDWGRNQVALFHMRKEIPRKPGEIFLNPSNSSQMSKVSDYRTALRESKEWEPYLRQNSGLPGPRANLELAQAAALEGREMLFLFYLQRFSPQVAPTGSPDEFLAMCGAVGLGRLLAEGRHDMLPRLRKLASDPRWRMREAVCLALQMLGDVNMPALLDEMAEWSQGSLLEQRAAIASLSEPRLLQEEAYAARALEILDQVTASFARQAHKGGEECRVLRQGLSYCWSIQVVALPDQGKPKMAAWCASKDRFILEIMRENLGKKRLRKREPAWVEKMQPQVSNNLIRLKGRRLG